MTVEHFPKPWLDLITSYTDLGDEAAKKISAIESKLESLERQGISIFPPRELRYRALKMVSPDTVKVCIIGQDPYHGIVQLPGGVQVPEATGLAFSVPRGARLPPSLRNIFKELSSDLGIPLPSHGDLADWAKQGVLMLNTVLTVEKDMPKSHDKFGWQVITSALVQALSKSRRGVVFILWGNSAKTLRSHIADRGHTIIESSHPSPIGGSCNKGFFGSRPFSRANEALIASAQPAIRWLLH